MYQLTTELKVDYDKLEENERDAERGIEKMKTNHTRVRSRSNYREEP